MATVLIRVRVKPRARTASLEQRPDGSWAAQVKSPAEAGRANAELIALLAAHFHCPKAAVSIKSGISSRNKVVRIEAAAGVGEA